MAEALVVRGLSKRFGGLRAVQDVSFTVQENETVALIGPNGAGKSTLGYTLAGREGYDVTDGVVTFLGEDLLALEPHERAARGLFLGFQYPVEIPGVSSMQFIRESLNAQKRARQEQELSGAEFIRLAKAEAAELGADRAEVVVGQLRQAGDEGVDATPGDDRS